MEPQKLDHDILRDSVGVLKYQFFENYGYKLIVEIDQGISDFYRSLIPKSRKPMPQMYKAHITVVRNEIPTNLDFWGKYENELINFQYSNVVNFGKMYAWLNTFSNRLEEIRLELGLPVSSQYTLPPEGFIKCFHSTIGNYKLLKI